MPDEFLKQLVPVQLSNQSAGVIVVGDIGRILGQDVSHQWLMGCILFP
jgi:hypothetical protein